MFEGTVLRVLKSLVHRRVAWWFGLSFPYKWKPLARDNSQVLEASEPLVSRSVVYLFADTNLLLQCLPMEELDWSAWNNYDEVRLIISSPVLREIDYRKNKGNDRIGRRARSTSAMFRKMLNDQYKVVRDSNPCVKLSVEPQHKYCETLKDSLNYQERDDQLIGTVYEFSERNHDSEVRLLTHDTIPIYTARNLGLTVDIIPDEWMLRPENTESEKELSALRAENARLKKAEPQFEIRCSDNTGAEIEQYKSDFTRFDPLTITEIDELIQYLKDRFPMESDFGPRESAERETPQSIIRILRKKEVFIPVKDEEIEKYRKESYPQWLERCKKVLGNYHQTLQRKAPVPGFVFYAENRGTRPAADALITIKAHGKFQIKPPTHEEEDPNNDGNVGESLKNNTNAHLSPPSPPQGSWKTIVPYSGLIRSLENVVDGKNIAIDSFNLDLSQRVLRQDNDPNAFYYKPDRPRTPQEAFCLECDQWRHEDGEENFSGEIYFSTEKDTVSGALVCLIQAENLSKPQFKRIPVQITTVHESAFKHARALVVALAEQQ